MLSWLRGVVAASLLIVAFPACAEDMLQRVRDAAKADVDRPWSVTRTGADYDDKGVLKARTVAHYDAAQPAGKRWTLTSINGAQPTAQQRTEFASLYRANRLPPTYAIVQNIVAGSCEKISETTDEVRYRVTAMPAGTTAVKSLDLTKFTVAEITVDKQAPTPFVSAVRIFAPEAFRPVPGGKVTRLERVMKFGLNSAGLPVLMEHSMTADASVLFKSIKVRSVASFSNQEAGARITTAGLGSTTARAAR